MKKLVISFIILGSFLIISYAVGVHQIWDKLFSPGPLSQAHEELDKSGDCAACHTRGKKLENNKCLVCHSEIKEKIESKSGLHARVSQECATCHSEHHGQTFQLVNLDEYKFDHNDTGWPLEGKHSLLKCQVCHTQKGYLLNKKTCKECHQDQHNGEYGHDCSECHNQNSFKVDQ